MNWKLKLVLYYDSLTHPLGAEGVDLKALRKKAAEAARMGSRVFDTKVEVDAVSDVHAGHIPLRIYQNSDASGKRVIMYYHGGGFALYDITSHDHVCRRLCAMNDCVVVSVDYRLAPEHPYPAAHEDAFAAIEWVRHNILVYGGNSADIVVAGDSAGGNLAACMAHRCRREGIALTAQVLIYPWIDGKLTNPSIARNGQGYLLRRDTMLWFQRQYTPREEDHCIPGVSPCYEEDHSGLAPALILTAEYDPLLDDGLNYYQQLKAAGTPAEYHAYPGLIHGFINIPGIDPNAMKAYSDIRDFLNEVKEPNSVNMEV